MQWRAMNLAARKDVLETKGMKVFSALFLIFPLALSVFGQVSNRDAQFDAVAESYESGNYEQTISLLAAYEKSNGTSPRLESLRALAYRDLDKPKEAYQAILVYFRLTAKRDMSGSEAHQDMLKLRDEMLEAIEKKYEDEKKKLDEAREEKAERVIAELERTYQSPDVRRSTSSSPPPSNVLVAAAPASGNGPAPTASARGLGLDALVELEMWRKINQSTVAMDYFLFIETFPDGQFAEIARKKMLGIGDPVWNQVRDTFDPFKFRDFINTNPDSPFIGTAKARMDELAKAALEWEQIKDTTDQRMLKGFEVRNPGHPLAAEAKRLRSEMVWKGLSGNRTPARLEAFINEFPEVPRAVDARKTIEELRPEAAIVSVPSKEGSDPAALFRMAAVHQHGGVQLGIGDVSFDGARLVFREREQVGMGAPDSTHTFSIACSELKDVKYKYHTLTLATRSGVQKQLIPATEMDGSQDKIKEKLEILEKGCGLKK